MSLLLIFCLLFLALSSGLPIFSMLLSFSFFWLMIVDFFGENSFLITKKFLLDFLNLGFKDGVMSIPAFVFLSVGIDKLGVMKSLVAKMSSCFKNINAPLALPIIVILVGTVWGSLTGLVAPVIFALGFWFYPYMKKFGYSTHFSIGLICASGSLGQLIPPSTTFIVVADLLDLSAPVLLRHVVLPAILVVLGFCLYVYVLNVSGRLIVRKNVSAEYFFDKNVLLQKQETENIYKNLLFLVFIILFVWICIFGEYLSLTEVAVFTSCFVVLHGLLHCDAKIGLFEDVALQSAKISGILYAVVFGGYFFATVLMEFQGVNISNMLSEALKFFGNVHIFSLFLLFFVVFCLGFFLDGIEIVLILLPAIRSILMLPGVDGLYIGAVVGLAIQMSFFTPPFGYSLFYMKSMFDSGMENPGRERILLKDVFVGVLPFVAIEGFVLLLMLLFPSFFGFNQ